MARVVNRTTTKLELLPVATIVHLIVTVVLSIDLLLDGQLSKDAVQYAAIVEGGTGRRAASHGAEAVHSTIAPMTMANSSVVRHHIFFSVALLFFSSRFNFSNSFSALFLISSIIRPERLRS